MRAASVCAEPGCPNLADRRGRCAAHAPAPWAGSEQDRDRRGVLRGTTLQRERAAAIRRAGGRCADCGAPGVALVLHHATEDPGRLSARLNRRRLWAMSRCAAWPVVTNRSRDPSQSRRPSRALRDRGSCGRVLRNRGVHAATAGPGMRRPLLPALERPRWHGAYYRRSLWRGSRIPRVAPGAKSAPAAVGGGDPRHGPRCNPAGTVAVKKILHISDFFSVWRG